METKRICPNCRVPLPPDVPLGLCPECLVKAGFDTGTDPGFAGQGSGSRFVPPPVEEIARLFPQLEILRLIGRGGMGAVYQARQPTLDRLVALKVLPPAESGGTGFAERFNREARALARLNHPNIVAVHDFGKASSLHYLVMEFVDGTNLREVERSGRLAPEQALAIVPQICDALQFAHNEGIVHRDVKPENILLDKRGRVKITDFGIAKMLGKTAENVSLTGVRDVIGTPHYMAPEQVESPQWVDHRADIFSLGVVFYEMLTGELPLGRFAPPSSRMRGIHADVRLDEVVLRALEKEPERRYQHASEVKTDVETIATTATTPAGKTFSDSVAAESGIRHPPPGITPRVSASGVSPGETRAGVGKWIFVARWLARISGTALLLFYGVFVLAEGLPPIPSQPQGVQLNFIALGIMLAGFVAGWKREGTAALLIASGWTLWQISETRIRWNVFQTPLPVAALYGFCWWGSRGRRTGVAIAVAATLSLALGMGRLFCPTSVFIQGVIRDARNRTIVPNAELTLLPQRKRSPDEPDRPNARSALDGHFRLYVGWYSPGKELRISAPGYGVLTTNLGPRSLGRRELERDFGLQPLAGASGWSSAWNMSPDYGDAVLNSAVGRSDRKPGSPVNDAPPVVVSTTPPSGASDVHPGLAELRVTFSKEMQDRSWSWATWGDENYPETTGEPHYLADGRTCVLPVKLQPGKLYAVWLNSEKFQNFRGRDGRSAVPYLLIFQTRK